MSRHEQMILNNDAVKTIPFLREKFDNHSLCTFRNNLAWLECQYGSGVWNISSHTSLKCNQHNPIWKELLQTDGKTTDLYCRSVFPPIHFKEFSLDSRYRSIRGFRSIIGTSHLYLTEDSQAHEMNKKGASKGTSLWRTFKNLREVWEWQNYQNKAIKSTKISKTIRTVRTFRTLWTSNFF